MPGRALVCAIAMMGIAMPAAAGERSGYSPTTDVLGLLMQDDSATFGPEVPVSRPAPPSLAEFEQLNPPAAIVPAAMASDGASPFALAANASVLPEGTTATFGGRYAIDDAMTAHPRPYRPRDVLDTMVTFRLDGQQETRSFSVGGGVAGAVWGAIPRN